MFGPVIEGARVRLEPPRPEWSPIYQRWLADMEVTRYLVQLYSKLSFPLVHVIMALVAIPFALVSPRSGGRAMGIGVAIVIAAGYWVVHSVAIAFAQADLLPAALAAWTADIVFAGIGTALFLSART